MNVEFLRQFYKDINKIKEPSIKDKITALIDTIENSNSIMDIPNIKKA